MGWHYLALFVPAYLGTMFFYVFFDSPIVLVIAALCVFFAWCIRRFIFNARADQTKIETQYWIVWPGTGLILATLSIWIYGV